MRTLRPFYALLLVLVVFGTVMAADFALEGGFSRESFTRVQPNKEGWVHLDLGELATGQVHFYRFLNYGNQEVRFFVGRDDSDEVHVAFDANEACYKLKRGYSYGDGWLVCNKCDKAFELKGINSGGGGCSPVPIPFKRQGSTLTLSESDILAGWRFFR
jgi:uncharacterized membrane protein